RQRRAGRDPVDQDPVRAKLEGHGFGQIDDPRLRRDVSTLQPQRHQAHNGGDVDDAATALPAHEWGERAAYFEDGGQIPGDDPVPFGARELVERHTVGERVDPGVVDQNVEPAGIGLDPLSGRGQIVRAGDVEAKPSAAARGGANLVRIAVGVVNVAP